MRWRSSPRPKIVLYDERVNTPTATRAPEVFQYAGGIVDSASSS